MNSGEGNQAVTRLARNIRTGGQSIQIDLNSFGSVVWVSFANEIINCASAFVNLGGRGKSWRKGWGLTI